MFGFRKKTEAPVPCPANPGQGIEGTFNFSSGNRSWSEMVILLDLAAETFRQHGYQVSNEGSHLHHDESGFLILPQFAGFEQLGDGGLRSVTTMQVNHPTLAPHGLFEYQHSTGDNASEAIFKGFDQWVQTDFVALLDALHSQCQKCTAMQLDLPAEEGRPARARRAVLGPVSHYMQQPPTTEADTMEEHPFCPCCLLTHTFEAFRELLLSDAFYGVRFFALRDVDGTTAADCRVNGEDWERGVVALREYAKTWPAAGYEFRKQYVVLHSLEPNA